MVIIATLDMDFLSEGFTKIVTQIWFLIPTFCVDIHMKVCSDVHVGIQEEISETDIIKHHIGI